MAAYLVGARGTARHALLLGLVVTASHTVGVYLLGAVTLYASRHVVPERLYPWLGAASGVLITLLGVCLLWRRLGRPFLEPRGHAPDHSHGGDGPWSPRRFRGRPRGRCTPGASSTTTTRHGHDHGHGHHHHHVPEGPVSLRALVALGVSGGIVPCPAALVVLLSAVAMGRVGFGLLLIVAFSVGLAAVLIAIGLLVVYARRLAARVNRAGVEGPLVRRWLPVTSAAVITAVGRRHHRPGPGRLTPPSKEELAMDVSLATALGLGLLLGLRHALDADHVAAVSTLVARERGLARSCLLGAFWGAGHTLALLGAGIAVIAFKLTITPGLEEALERMVGAVLVLLGGHVLLRAVGGLLADGREHTTRRDRASSPAAPARARRSAGHVHLLRLGGRPFLVGLLHGLAGSAALTLLVLGHHPVSDRRARLHPGVRRRLDGGNAAAERARRAPGGAGH